MQLLFQHNARHGTGNNLECESSSARECFRFKLTACNVSILSAPVILTAISLWETTLTVHWIGRVSVLDRFYVKKQKKISGEVQKTNITEERFFLFLFFIYQAKETGKILR